MQFDNSNPGSANVVALPANFNVYDVECWGADSGFSPGGYVKARIAGLTGSVTAHVGGYTDTEQFAGGRSYNSADPDAHAAGGSGIDTGDGLVLVAGGAGGFVVDNLAFIFGGRGGPTGDNGQQSTEGNNPMNTMYGFGATANANGAGGIDMFYAGLPGAPGVGYKGGSATSLNVNAGGGGGGLWGGGSGTGVQQPAEALRYASGGGGSNGISNTAPGTYVVLGDVINLYGDDVNAPPKPIVQAGGFVRLTAVGFATGYTQDPVIYVVDPNVNCLEVELWGADGGSSPSQTVPSVGGYCKAQMTVAPGDILVISCGQKGTSNLAGVSPGGFLTGGSPANSNGSLAGGGGAGTGILDALNTLMIAAGGGGGASHYQGSLIPETYPGGNGGGLSGGSIGSSSGQGGQPFAAGAGGVGGVVNGNAGVNSLGGDGGALAPMSPFLGSGTGGGGGGFYAGGGGGISTNFPINSIAGCGAGGGGSSNYNISSSNPINSFETGVTPPNPNLSRDGFVIITPIACVCVAQGTQLETEVGPISIENLRPGQIVRSGESWCQVDQVAEMRHIPGELIQCEANCFGPNSPSQGGLTITSSHPMLINGFEVNGQQLLDQVPGVQRVRNHTTKVFTLITKERTFVNMNGVLVGTWGSKAWSNFLNSDAGRRCSHKYLE